MKSISPYLQIPKHSKAPFRNSTDERISTASLCSFHSHVGTSPRFKVEHLDSSVILNTIDPDKDVDGCHAFNQGRLYNSDFKTLINVPCAALAMTHFLQISPLSISDHPSLHVYKIPTHRKRAVIIGNSALVGYPCFCMLQRMGCTCSMCHKDTVNVPSYTREVMCPSECSLGGPCRYRCRQSPHD